MRHIWKIQKQDLDVEIQFGFLVAFRSVPKWKRVFLCSCACLSSEWLISHKLRAVSDRFRSWVSRSVIRVLNAVRPSPPPYQSRHPEERRVSKGRQTLPASCVRHLRGVNIAAKIYRIRRCPLHPSILRDALFKRSSGWRDWCVEGGCEPLSDA